MLSLYLVWSFVYQQIGGRITSKRIAQMLEACSPFSYIMVDKHPYRHDPSHIVTHRIQSTITEFAHYLLKVSFPRKTTRWHTFLQVLNMTVRVLKNNLLFFFNHFPSFALYFCLYFSCEGLKLILWVGIDVEDELLLSSLIIYLHLH